MKTFISIIQCAILVVLITLIAFFTCQALDTQWEEGIYIALNHQAPSFRGFRLEYDENGAPTIECIEHLKKTAFNGREFDESRIEKFYDGHCIPSDDELIELERIFGNINIERE